jgi:hypothetical protein
MVCLSREVIKMARLATQVKKAFGHDISASSKHALYHLLRGELVDGTPGPVLHTKAEQRAFQVLRKLAVAELKKRGEATPEMSSLFLMCSCSFDLDTESE